MKITKDKLEEIIQGIVKKKLSEALTLKEGPREIPIRMIMDDLKDVVVGSVTEDIARELMGVDEKVIERAVQEGYAKMTHTIVVALDAAPAIPGSGPRRRMIDTVPAAVGQK